MSMRNTTVTPPKQAPGGFNLPSAPGPLAPVPPPGKPVVVGRQSRRLVRFDTLGGQFTTLVLLSVILSILGLAVSFLVLSGINDNFRSIIDKGAPSVTAAQKLGQAIQDADAEAANYQLYSRIDVTSPDYEPKVYGDNGLRQQSWNNFLRRRQQTTDMIFLARSNATTSGEADAINIISDRFLDYVARINVMKYELDQGHKEAALAAYKSAHDLLIGNLNNVQLDDKGRTPEEVLKLNGWKGLDPNRQYLGIEANIEKLSQINRTELQQASNRATSSINLNTLVVVALCILLVVGLGFLSFRHAVTTHRVLNPGYVLAFIGALALTVSLAANLLNARQDYNTVAVDSFLSIEAAARIRQLAYDANADKSRLLLSPESPGLDSSSPALTADVRRAFRQDALEDNFNKKQQLIKDQLALAWANVTYSGERNALCKTAVNIKGAAGCPSGSTFFLDDYLKLDATIRDDFKKSLLAEAIKINVGASNQTFDNFDKAITDLSAANEVEFDKSSCNAIGRTQFGNKCSNPGYVPTFQYGVLVFFPLIALATLGGFWYVRREF